LLSETKNIEPNSRIKTQYIQKIQNHCEMAGFGRSGIKVLILAECSIIDYGTLELQEALNNNTGKNAAGKRKVDSESPQEDTNKQFLTLTETIIQNSKRFKEDSTVLAQQSTESTILSLKNEQPTSKTKSEDIYSSQWVVTKNEAEEARISQIRRCLNRYGRTSIIEWQENKNMKVAYIKLEYRSEKERTILENSWSIHYDAGARKNSLRGSLSDKTNSSSGTQRITEVGKQTYSLFSSEKRPRSDSRSSSKERPRPNKSSLKISESDQVKTSLLTQTAIDKMWESFEDGIIYAAKKNIPFKIIKGSQPNYKVKHKSKEKKGRSLLHTSTIQISKLYRKLTKMYKTSKFIDSKTLLESNQIILEVNTKLDTQIQALSNTISKEMRVLFRCWGLEKEKKKFKDIKMYTDLRCKMLQNDQGRMLRNLLDKSFRSIKLDHILENVNGQSVLISDPTEVKRRTQQHFQTQYQDRNTTNGKVTEDWEQIYTPKKEIKDEWYKILLTAITIDEWSSMLSNLKNKTALGISGIGYLLIKNVNRKTQEWFI
ncbi:3095_t:CDS:2, partial [Gigaspora margarita]